MKRSWRVAPDLQMETPEGPVGVISQDALAKAVYDGAVMMSRAGGHLSVLTKRYPTGIPDEMVTIDALVEWKDRTDARAAREEVADPAPLRVVEEAVVVEPERPEVDESELPAELRTGA